MDFRMRRRRLEIEQGLDVAAHDSLLKARKGAHVEWPFQGRTAGAKSDTFD
jgi:hypothetical protein